LIQQSPEQLLHALLYLHEDMLSAALPTIERWTQAVSDDRQHIRYSLENLAHYVALRRHDLREIQDSLQPLGLSSLGRIESRVLPNLDAVINTLGHLSGYDNLTPEQPSLEDFSHGRQLLDRETDAVLGALPDNRRVRIMVTMPSHAAKDAHFVRQLVEHGMDIARINCAHDSPDDWADMIKNIRVAESLAGRKVKIAMDLVGPKVRTADIVQPDGNRVHIGDVIFLTCDTQSVVDDYPDAIQVRCTTPDVIPQIHCGDKVWFDDGKIGTVVEAKIANGLVLRVTHASKNGDKLKAEKGINFPDSQVMLETLSDKDKADLDFVVKHADIVNYSFVQTVDDVKLLQSEIAKRQPEHPIALVLKIETALAVRNLPELIAAAMSQQPVGVMIARGDLAVEIGYERLAEMQEEILWMCEAAHVPVIWATQVLENLAKKGRPSRSEVTDAAMSERAEAVMLNKGDYILRAVDILDGILARMHSHQSKKDSRLRALQSW